MAKKKLQRQVQTKLFLSYSRKDLKMAERLHVALQEQGFEVLLDRTDIAPGEDWKARLGQLIHEADAIIFALSPHSTASSVCGWEVEEAARLGKRILPALIVKVVDAEVPPTLGKLNFISFLKRDFGQAIADVVSALNTNLDWVREHTRLSELALVWDRKGRDTAQILRGRGLQDAEAWMASQPENAASPTELQRAFIASSRTAASGRQRNWVAGSVAVAVVSAGLAVWGEINRREADTQRTVAVQQRDRAETVLKAATATSHSLVFDISQEFRNVEGVPLATIKRVLEKARSLQTELGKAGGATPDMRRDEAAALDELATTYQAQGATEDAMSAANESMAIIAELVKSEPESDKWRRYQAVTFGRFADILVLQGKNVQANGYFAMSVEICKLILHHQPENTQFQIDYSVILDRIGDQELANSNPQKALENFDEAFAIRKKLVDKKPPNVDWQHAYALSHAKRGEALEALSKPVDALAEFKIARDQLEKLIVENPQNMTFKRDSFAFSTYIAKNLAASGKLNDAAAVYVANVNDADDLASRDFQNYSWQRDLAFALMSAGTFERENGLTEQAQPLLKRSVDIYDKLVKSDTRNVGWIVENAQASAQWGNLLLDSARASEAVPFFENAVGAMRRFVDLGSANKIYPSLLARYLRQSAAAYGKINDRQKAYDAQNESLELQMKVLAKTPNNETALFDVAEAQLALGDLQYMFREEKLAELNFKASNDNFRALQKLAPDDPAYKLDLAVGLVKLGNTKFALQDGQAAFENYSQALEIYKGILSKDNNNAAAALNMAYAESALGEVFLTSSQTDLAINHFKSSQDLLDQLARFQPENTTYLINQFDAYVKLGDVGDNRKANYQKALELAEALVAKGKQAPQVAAKIPVLKDVIAKLN
jgi:tetratricopeptide (TPR) repeat protein